MACFDTTARGSAANIDISPHMLSTYRDHSDGMDRDSETCLTESCCRLFMVLYVTLMQAS